MLVVLGFWYRELAFWVADSGVLLFLFTSEVLVFEGRSDVTVLLFGLALLPCVLTSLGFVVILLLLLIVTSLGFATILLLVLSEIAFTLLLGDELDSALPIFFVFPTLLFVFETALLSDLLPVVVIALSNFSPKAKLDLPLVPLVFPPFPDDCLCPVPEIPLLSPILPLCP